MVSRQQDRLWTAAHRDQARPATVRSALLDRNTPRPRRAHRVRFQDLEEDDAGGVAPGGRAVPERHRLGAGPGSPHPNRKSPPGGASSSSAAVGVVREDVAGPAGGVATVLARVPPHPLAPGPARRPLAPPPPLPLSVTRTHSHSLEDVIGTEGPEDRMKRATPNRPPRPVAAPLQPISPPLPPLRTDSSHCPPVSMVTGSNGPAQIRRQRLGRALSDPGNEDPPRPPRPTLPRPTLSHPA
ncbi:proline-rich receptor-like protein kinase PERK9 [Anguilla anguilla]|uniref:proline-rich receptor-like protein kinase PERK9 n=1 Tax=Anguilla anguilla TaxID=7936 RepID=UPI0015A8473F|nr:proline-rich receptor-like protein kinase PERK9 [Anguilla anguilla]